MVKPWTHAAAAAEKKKVATNRQTIQPMAPLKYRFLDDLPAELRIQIYEYTLIAEEEKVTITRETFAQPSLLQTCKQIRSEASPVYYLGHIFSLWVENYDAALIVAFCRQAGENWSYREMRISVGLLGASSSWVNLVEWCEHFYNRD